MPCLHGCSISASTSLHVEERDGQPSVVSEGQPTFPGDLEVAGETEHNINSHVVTLSCHSSMNKGALQLSEHDSNRLGDLLFHSSQVVDMEATNMF